MAGVPYAVQTGGLSKAPKGKLPYIRDEGRLIGDTTLIREINPRGIALLLGEFLGFLGDRQRFIPLASSLKRLGVPRHARVTGR